MRYVFNTGDSKVSIRAHAPMHDTHAKSTQVSGEIEATFDEAGVAHPGAGGHAEVRVDTFSSGNKLLDMNTLRHIGARKFPVARFEIGGVETGDGSTTVTGTLDFHGVSRAVSAVCQVALDDDGATVSVTGDWTLTQSDFGLRPPRLAMLKVDDEIAVRFTLVARSVNG